ncbi:hypothetical protein H9Q13_07690 [Pontibacter sp. JH31]|uniref:Lipoprotein n=1 Tax=Pontibacter aquaedesilientis TaxID=2766980 RepID=A0ABR7XFK3_9BACT|nr:hypothetical protein [Pontibacter aquaedesilientis]MBD1397044.1 hypothetical protein [Pontibacter aquaedesilientis]
MKYAFPLLTLCALIFGCNRSEPEHTSSRLEQPAYDMSTWVKADLECEELRNADEDDPQAVVYLNQLETSYLIDTVYTCSVIAPEMYRTYDIPRNALSACGGWWAGSGHFYYTLQEGDSIAVMHAYRIQHDSLGFEYKLKQRLPAMYSAE